MELSTIVSLKKYVQGELSGEEIAQLESRLKNEPTLQAELELTKALIKGAGDVERERLVRMVGNGKGNAGKIIKKPFLRYALLVAAAIMVLIAITFSVNHFLFKEDIPPTTYIAEGYIDPLNTTTRNNTNNFSLAFNDYLNGNYEQGIERLKIYPYLSDDTLHYDIVRLRGHLFFKIGDYESAIEAFDECLKYEQVEFIDENNDRENVEWMRLLSMYQLLIQGQKGRGLLIRELKSFILNAEQDDIYYKKASGLLEFLGSDSFPEKIK